MTEEIEKIEKLRDEYKRKREENATGTGCWVIWNAKLSAADEILAILKGEQ